MLGHLKLNFKIQKFCSEIFESVLEELDSITEQLNVDFSGLYEKWSEQIKVLAQLKRFLDGGDADLKSIKGELQVIFGNFKSDQEAQLLL